MNNQKPSRFGFDADGKLAVHSIFLTIQGEGPFVGRPAIFVRLFGCNLQCPLCDTDYTSKQTDYYPNEVLEKVDSISGAFNYKPLIVISGGEPFRQNILPFCNLLVRCGYCVQIETNGTLQLNINAILGLNIQVVCSPKAGNIHSTIEAVYAALKYVGRADDLDSEDGLPIRALGHPASPRLYRPKANGYRPIYLQPADEQDTLLNRKNLDACVASCIKHGYSLCLQVHKIIGVE